MIVNNNLTENFEKPVNSDDKVETSSLEPNTTSNPNILKWDPLIVGQVVNQLIREVLGEIIKSNDFIDFKHFQSFINEYSDYTRYDVLMRVYFDFSTGAPQRSLSPQTQYKLYWLTLWTYNDKNIIYQQLVSWLYSQINRTDQMKDKWSLLLFNMESTPNFEDRMTDKEQKRILVQTLEEVYNKQIKPYDTNKHQTPIEPNIFINWLKWKNRVEVIDGFLSSLFNLDFSTNTIVMEVDGQLVESVQNKIYKFTSEFITQKWIDWIKEKRFYTSSLLTALNENVSDDELLRYFDADGTLIQKYGRSKILSSSEDILDDYLRDDVINFITVENKLQDYRLLIKSAANIQKYSKWVKNQYNFDNLKAKYTF